MILVTGGTGFIGKALVRNLAQSGYPVRILIRPSPQSPNLPSGIPVEVAVCSLNDYRGLRAAMVGIDTIYHLAGVERRGAYGSLMNVDIQGTQTIIQTAQEAGVKRIVYLSHLGADRASAYAVFKAKAIAEEIIRRSGIEYTILRSAIVYGPNDGFTTGLALLLASVPFIFLVPGEGSSLLQPIWVEDLVTCMIWAMEEKTAIEETIEIGGPEYLTFNQVLELVMQATGIHRRKVHIRPPYLRSLTVLLETIFPGLPVSTYWLDYLATNRTCALDTVPRLFRLMPGRMSQHLGYLQSVNWRRPLLRTLFKSPR